MNNLSSVVQANIEQSEADGGLWLENVPVGKQVLIQTENTLYTLEHPSEDGWLISGHPKYCPTPASCSISGSTWGGSMLKMGFVGVGMHLEFHVEGFSRLTTSQIKTVESK